MKTSDFNFELPQELIAQTPIPRRDASRLLVLDKDTGAWEHRHFYDLPDYLREEAGIPEKAKLCASVDEEEHTVTISEADYNHDLRDVPEEVLEMFRGAEVCVGELEERLILGDVVYGN